MARQNLGQTVGLLAAALMIDCVLLHNQRAQWLKALLLIRGNQRINVISVPWYLKA